MLLSMLSQERSLWLWANDQNPLTESEIDDLDNKISTAQGELMHPLVGMIFPSAAQTTPQGTLLCDGSTYARSDYPNLYDALDPAFIIDSTSFFVPDLRGNFVLGESASHTIASSGGAETHTQTIGELAPHDHTTIPHVHSEVTALPTPITIGAGVPAPSAIPGVGLTGSSDVIVNSEGGGNPMDIMPPFYTLRYVMVAL